MVPKCFNHTSHHAFESCFYSGCTYFAGLVRSAFNFYIRSDHCSKHIVIRLCITLKYICFHIATCRFFLLENVLVSVLVFIRSRSLQTGVPTVVLKTGRRSKVHSPLAICPIDSNKEKHTTTGKKILTSRSSLWAT